MQMKSLAEQLHLDTQLPLVFYEVEISEPSVYGIFLSEPSASVDRPETRGQLAQSVFQLLELVPLRWNAPTGSLSRFVDFHAHICACEPHVEALLAISFIRMRAASWTERQWVDFLPSLDDELQSRAKRIEQQTQLFMELVGLHGKLAAAVRQLSRLLDAVEEAASSQLYRSFIDGTPALVAEFHATADALLADQAEFSAFFERSLRFLAPALLPRLKVHQHCWMLSALSFDRWLPLHSEFGELDGMIARASDEAIQWFCVDPAPLKARKLFQSVAFEEAFALLRAGRAAMLPLIALPKISAAIELLNDLFCLDYQTSAQADELTPLLHFLFLKCKVPKLFSFMQYVDAFAKPLMEKNIIQLPESVIVGHTHIVNHMDSLAFFLKKEPEEGEARGMHL
jgi:hypothetical protein